MADTLSTLTQSITVGLATQTDEGVKETILAADCARALQEAQLPQWETEEVQRALTGDETAREPSRIGKKKQTLAHSEWLYAKDASTLPYADPALIACGMQREQLRAIEATINSGTFRMGERITDGAMKEAVFVAHRQNAAGDTDYLVYALIGGSADFASADNIVGDDTSADATADAEPDDAGSLYRPQHEPGGTVPKSATVTHYRGGREYTIIGARGDAQLEFAEGQPAVGNFTFQGPPDLDAGLGLPAGTPPSSIPEAPNTAPLATGGTLMVDPETDNWNPPIVRSLAVNFGNQVVDRATITEGAIGQTGYRAPRISGRETSLAFDPEDVDDATHDVVEALMAGRVFELSLIFGDWTASGGAIATHVKRAQYTGLTYEDNQGRLTNNITVSVRRHPDRIEWDWFLAFINEPAA